MRTKSAEHLINNEQNTVIKEHLLKNTDVNRYTNDK